MAQFKIDGDNESRLENIMLRPNMEMETKTAENV